MKELPLLLLGFVFLIFPINGMITPLVNCDDLTNESLEDIALTPCVRLNSSSGYVLGPADDDSMWNSFVEQLEDIYVNVEMVNSTATEFGISHLNEINNDEVTITNNANLKTVTINQDSGNSMAIKKLIIMANPKLTRVKIRTPGPFVGSIKIIGNNELLEIELDMPAFEEQLPATGQIQILNNPKLSLITMKKVNRITVTGDFEIRNNQKLMDLQLLQLRSIFLRGDFAVTNNDVLRDVKAPNLKTIHIEGHLAVSENTAMTRMEFAKLEHITVEKAMMFTKNDRLSRIYFGALTEFHVSQLVAVQNPGLGSLGLELHFLNTTDLLIAGNRDFNKKELANIRKMQMATNKVKAYIQKEGECSFSEEITDPLELEGCKSVRGDLILAKTFPGHVAGTPLVEVQGNVELGDTEHESLGFLAGTKVTGYISSNRCGFKSLHGVPVRSCYERELCPSCGTCQMWVIILGVVSGMMLLILVAWCFYVECFKDSHRSLLKRVPAEPAAHTPTPRMRTPINKENFDVEDYY